MNANDLDPNLYRDLLSDLKVEISFIINQLISKIGMAKISFMPWYSDQTGGNDTGSSALIGTDLTCCETLAGDNPPQNQHMRYPAPWIF